MIPGISELYGTDATTMGTLLLERADDLVPPPGASGVAAHVALLPELVAQARAAQGRLEAGISAVSLAAAAHRRGVAAARAAEKALDAAFAALCARLAAEAREGTAGARDLAALLFPDGSYPVTRLKGGPQLGAYQRWCLLALTEAATTNLAYAAVAGKVGAFRDRVDAFAAILRERTGCAGALMAARAERDAAQAAWTLAFRDLLFAAARIQGADSDASRAWLAPLRDWKAAQRAARTRRAARSAAGEGEAEGDG